MHACESLRRSLMPSLNQVTIGTCFCASGAKLYGTPCRNRPYSPSDSPWSLT
jgi:hypothetical protein